VHNLKGEAFCQLRAGICQQAVSFWTAGRGSSLDWALFCPSLTYSCPEAVGSKSTVAVSHYTHTDTHTPTGMAGLHTRICTCTYKKGLPHCMCKALIEMYQQFYHARIIIS